MQVQPISQTKQANQPLPEPIVDVKSFCARFENNIWLDVPFLDMYFRTAFKNMSALGDAYQKELNRETERVLRYFDRLIEEEAKKAKAQARAQAKKQAKKEETQTRVKRGGVLDWDSEERLPSIPEAQESVPEQPEPLPEPKKDAKTRTATTKSTTAIAPLAKYRKFAVKRNCKEPACTWSDQSNWTKTPFDPSFRNTGIPTGPANNLLVVDLDVKDDGVLEFQNYISEHGNPKTLTVRTPSGGYHYYFNYSSANPDDNILIKAFLKNASKYRGKGVDVRSAGGYVVGPPSRRDGKSYAILNETAPIDIPSSLISWLLVGKAPVVKEKRGKKEVTRELAPNTYQYDLTEEQIKNILAMLPEKFLNNYSDWLLATTVLKFHGQRDIWEEWSKQSPSYNKTKNDEQWNYNKGFLDINYLVWVLRKAGEEIEFVTRFKPYTPIAKDISQVKQKSFNKAFVSEGFSYKAFEKHETIIIKSCTGTGKTTAVAQHVKQYMKQASGAKFLSITTRTSLSDQHQKSFEELGMRNYQDVRANFGDIESLTICLNSLAKLGDLDEDELKDYIVYIDEVSSFLEFTHNDTLDSILKQTFVLLSRLAKFAGKVIVSDALINDNTFEFLKHRRPEATLMLTNGFKKFKDVPAVRLRSEPAFLEKLIEHCNANQPFLFGSDSCDVVTKFFHRCVDRLTDQSLKDKFLLITADTDLRIKDASREWRDKFVFFSPKVTFGVDFSVEAAQDMFIYIKGASINPSGMFQQATRTRNIKTLYYHGETGNDESRYENLDQVYQNIETCLNMSKSLATSCSYVDENDELKFVHNSFFKMFCYNEYVNDVFASNKVKHFEGFLEQNGFEIMTEGQPQKLSKDEKAVQKGLVEQITEELFESFLTTNEITLPKFAPLLKNITYLGLNPFDRDTLRNFQDILVDKYRVKDHDSVIRLLKSTEHVDDRLAELSVKSIDAKLLNNGYQQTKLIHEFGVKFGITIFNLGEKTENTEAKMDDGFFKLVKQAFRVSRAKPSNRHEIKQLFVSIVKAATCRDIVKSKQLKSKEDRDVTAYFLNESLVKHHLELNAFKNKSGKGFAQEAVEKFGIAVESFENGDGFADDLDA